MRPLLSLRLNSDLADSRRAVRVAVEAERCLFDCFWYCEDLFKRDAWIVLSAVAAATETIGLGTAIVNPFSSSVVEIAMRASTLSELSDGRFKLGIGVGAQETLKWAGIQVDKPITSFVEAVEKLRDLLKPERGQRRLTFGSGFNIPIYIGGQGPKTVGLIGQLGDGGLPLFVPPEAATKFLPIIRNSAIKSGRSPDNLDISGCFWYYVAEDKEELLASKKLRELIAYYGPLLSDEVLGTAGLHRSDFSLIERLAQEGEFERALDLVTPQMFRLVIAGTYDQPDQIVRRFKQLMSQGVTHFNLGPPLGHDMEKTVEFTSNLWRAIKNTL